MVATEIRQDTTRQEVWREGLHQSKAGGREELNGSCMFVDHRIPQQRVGLQQPSEGEAQKDSGWQGRSVTILSGFWVVAHLALMITERELLGVQRP